MKSVLQIATEAFEDQFEPMSEEDMTDIELEQLRLARLKLREFHEYFGDNTLDEEDITRLLEEKVSYHLNKAIPKDLMSIFNYFYGDSAFEMVFQRLVDYGSNADLLELLRGWDDGDNMLSVVEDLF